MSCLRGGGYSCIAPVNMELPVGYHLDGAIKAVVCDTCGCCFAASRSREDDYEYYYTNSNFYAGNPISNNLAMEVIEEIIRLSDDLVRKDGAICDMGFGSGKLLKAFKLRGYSNLAGIDPSEDSVKNLKDEISNVSQGSIYEYQSALADQFDLITVVDVLEHLYNPHQALETVGKYLKKGGYLALSVPCFDHIDENMNLLPDNFNQEHINYFSSVAIDNLLSLVGFEPVTKKELQKTELVSVYRKNDVSAFDNSTLKRDVDTVERIKRYFKEQDKFLQSVDRRSNDLWNKGVRHLYVWGVGAFTMYLVANSRIADFDLHFVDGNPQKQGTEYMGKNVESPESIVEDWPIVICAMHSIEPIKVAIKAMGLQNGVVNF